jgi:hypothetical protein
MLTEDATDYDIYVEFFGRVRSGVKLTTEDYCFPSFDGSTPFAATQRVAATLAVDDQKSGSKMRPKKDVDAEIKRLLE